MSGSLNAIISIGFCLVGSAFFSGSETALTSLESAKATHLMESGGRSAKVLSLWIESPLKVLTTILIGNNIFNITASALAAKIAEDLLTDYVDLLPVDPIAIAVAVMTLLLLTFGEITPKALAKANAERIAVPILHLLRPLTFLLTPFSAVFIKLSHKIAVITGSSLSKPPGEVTVNYLEKLIEIGEREGTISEDDADMLQSVFDFSDTIAREIMIPRTDLQCVPRNISFNELRSVFIKDGHSRLPVYKNNIDEIQGVFYAKDLLQLQSECGDKNESATLELEKILRPVKLVPETKPINDLLREMQKTRTHMVVLVDEYGGVSGIVTIEDIIEEIFGEIRDEFDLESEDIIRLDKTTLIVSGRADLDDLEEELGVKLVDLESDTIGGYLLTQFGRFPEKGESFTQQGLTFFIEEASDRRIVRVRIESEPLIESKEE